MTSGTRVCIIVGALLTAAPLFGVLGTVIGMIRTFHALGESGIADPRFLSGSIGFAMIATVTGLVLCPFGIALLVGSFVFHLRTRTRQVSRTV